MTEYDFWVELFGIYLKSRHFHVGTLSAAARELEIPKMGMKMAEKVKRQKY